MLFSRIFNVFLQFLIMLQSSKTINLTRKSQLKLFVLLPFFVFSSIFKVFLQFLIVFMVQKNCND
jgi:hypothetical protein